MPADQAAGLRRRQAAVSQIVYVVSDTTSTASALAQALLQRGLTPLLVDARDRLFDTTAAHTLFDWSQQLARGQLLTLPLVNVTGWHAPGCRANVPGLAQATRHFDALIFDCTLAEIASPASGTREWALLSVQPDTLPSVYALLKTRALRGEIGCVLTGDAASCARVREACGRFLGPAAAAMVSSLHDEVDAIAALAVRMAHEEPGCQSRYKTGHT